MWDTLASQRTYSRSFEGRSDKRNITIHTGAMSTLGAMVGFDIDKISKWVGKKLEKHQRLFELLSHDELPAQIACLLLRLCAVPCMGYLLRVTPPPILAEHAQRFDRTVIETAARRLGLLILFLNRLFQPYNCLSGWEVLVSGQRWGRLMQRTIVQ